MSSRSTRAFVGGAGALTLVGLLLVIGLLGDPWKSNQAIANVDPDVEFTLHIGASNTAGDAKDSATIETGAEFAVSVSLDSIPGGETYSGEAVTINYTGAIDGPFENGAKANGDTVWPDCGFEAFANSAGSANTGCALGISGTPSTFTGTVANFELTCREDGSGTVSILHGKADTNILADTAAVALSDAGPDAINVDCLSATDTPTPTETPTPTDTPDATATPTPNPIPKMVFDDVDGLTCANNQPIGETPITDCGGAQLFAGDEKRAEYTLQVSATSDLGISYGGFETQIDFPAGLTYNSQGCTTEVVWSALADSQCSKTVVGSSVRLGGRTGAVSASTPFPKTTVEGALVRVHFHCATPGTHEIALRTTSGGGNPGSFFVNPDGSTVAAKAGNPPDVDIIRITCAAEDPEMSLSASGPGVTCVTAPTPPNTPDPNKPDKCVVPFEPAAEGTPATQTPFAISVRANVIPANANPSLNGYGGFDTHVYWGGLRYVLPKPSCLTEAIWPSAFLCAQNPSTSATIDKKHSIRSSLFPSFPASTYAGELLNMSLACPNEGQFRIVLNGNGTSFVNPENTVVPVSTISNQVLDPLTPTGTVVPFVDALLINCAIVPTATPTSTPTNTATPTATPCPTDGCPTSTSTPSTTPTPTNTLPPTNTPTRTNTPGPTNTPTNTPTITPTPTPCCELTNVTLFGPGKVSSDDEHDGATADDEVETSVTIVAFQGGKVTINEQEISHPSPAGYSFFGQQVEISAPGAAIVSNPLSIVFTLDTSITPAGATHNTVQVFKNGVKVPACTGGGTSATPNPCVSQRTTLTGGAAGDVQLTVKTTAASTWNFGVLNGTPTATPLSGVEGDVNCDGNVSPLDAQLILQFIVGLIPVLPCPENADVSGNGIIDATDALLILQLDAGIINNFP